MPDPVAHRLLRACGERPGRRAADNGDEFASFHYLPVPPNAYVRKDSTPTWQEFAALRDFDPVYVSLGSLASKAAEADRPCTSAAPPKADVNSPPWLPPLSAISRREQVQQILAKDFSIPLAIKKESRQLRRLRFSHIARVSGRLLPPSPPAEKATTCQDQARKASTGDGAGNRGYSGCSNEL